MSRHYIDLEYPPPVTTVKEFLDSKKQLEGFFGFEPIDIPDSLFGFQKELVAWNIRKGRSANFADCGMGKTLMGLTWCDNIYKHTGKPVMIMTPLAVAHQFIEEAEKLGFDAGRSQDGSIKNAIVVTNYERIHYFDANDFSGVYCDESSILKSFDGHYRKAITEFMRLMKYRLLGTATAAPNDFTEVGTSSQALGYLGYMDMLGRFFTNKQGTTHQMKGRFRSDEWRFKGHAENDFWRWMTSWARALRKPSDLGYDDNGFVLPELLVEDHAVDSLKTLPGMLIPVAAKGLDEQRKMRRQTVEERCEYAASLVNYTGEPAVVWCNLNDEGDLLEQLIPDSQQVSGRDSNESKEEKFINFSHGKTRVLITKPQIGAWGLNWQHCNHLTWFANNSYEQYYQAVRRCWRFGQTKPVRVDRIMTASDELMMQNVDAKEADANRMFTELVNHMNDSLSIQRVNNHTMKMELPKWLSYTKP